MGLMALLLLISRLMYGTQSFVCQRQSFPSKFRHIPILLQAKKSRTSTASKGFSKIEKREYSETPDETKPTRATSSEQQQEAARSPSFLQSLESGGSSAIPNFDENLPPEERTKMILREKYGMKTLEEQQLTIKQQEALKERKKKMEEWKKKIENEEFDVMAMLPAPVIVGIDRFLKAGLAVSGFMFILAGLGITLEAWSQTSGKALPENVDAFIVNTIEPNFTPGLVVLLAFSVSLGLFAAAQLGSQGAQYKE